LLKERGHALQCTQGAANDFRQQGAGTTAAKRKWGARNLKKKKNWRRFPSRASHQSRKQRTVLSRRQNEVTKETRREMQRGKKTAGKQQTGNKPKKEKVPAKRNQRQKKKGGNGCSGCAGKRKNGPQGPGPGKKRETGQKNQKKTSKTTKGLRQGGGRVNYGYGEKSEYREGAAKKTQKKNWGWENPRMGEGVVAWVRPKKRAQAQRGGKSLSGRARFQRGLEKNKQGPKGVGPEGRNRRPKRQTTAKRGQKRLWGRKKEGGMFRCRERGNTVGHKTKKKEIP